MFKDAWGLLFYSKRKVWQIPEKMRFSWERNDSLDLDTYSTTNLDTLFETYYRLENSLVRI